MRNLFINLITILLFSIFVIACTSDPDNSCKTNDDCTSGEACVDEKCVTDTSSSGLLFVGIADQDFIDGYRYDENGEKEGVQITVHASAKDFEDGADINLMIEGDEASKLTQKLKLLGDGTAVVTFEEFTLKDGESTLVLSAKNISNKLIETKLTVTVKELELKITDPLVDLKASEDQDTNRHYLQKDVKVDVKGLAIEDLVSVKLTLFKVVDGLDDVQRSTYTSSPKDGQVVFENVDFPEGKWKIVASVDALNNITISSDEVVLNAESAGGCLVTLIPASGTTFNQAYFADSNNATVDDKVLLKGDTDCPSTYQVRFVINPDDANEEIIPAVLSDENGKTVVSLLWAFPQDKDHNDLPSKVSIEVSEDFSNSQADGGFADAEYYVDTIGPELNIAFPSRNYEFFTLNDKDLTAAGMQFTVSGTTVDADFNKVLGVAVGDDDYQEFAGVINETTGAFDTNLLDTGKFVSVLTSGSHVLKFKAYDNHDNETVVELPITVHLGDISVSVTQIATKNVTSDTTEVKLNQLDDSELTVDNMQFVVSGSIDGLDSGRTMGLYIDDTKVLESDITADNNLSFNLNTEDLGLSDGVYNLYIKTLEINGPSSNVIKLFVSNTRPTLLLTGFTDGDYTSEPTVDIHFTTTGLSGDEKVNLKLNDSDLTPVTVDAQGFAVFSDVTLQVGPNAFIVTASDFEGNEAEQLNFTLNMDNENPNVAITAPSNGSTIKRIDDSNSLPGIQVTVRADVNNEIDGTDAKLFLGSNLLATAKVISNKLVFTDVTLLSSVENVLKIVVTDKAGNIGESQISVTVDDGCYDLQFLSPTLDNAKLNDSSFIGIVSVGPLGSTNPAIEGLDINLELNNSGTTVPAVISSGSSSFTGVVLSQGDNVLTLTYDVDASTQCVASVTVNYDVSAPVITALSITDKDSVSHSFNSADSMNLGVLYDTSISEGLQANIKLSVNDIEAGQMMQLEIGGVNTSEATVECDATGSNCFVLFDSLTLAEGGPYSLDFYVGDINGNESNHYFLTLNVDITKPVVAFDSDFPLSLNASPAVDEQSSITGLQYHVTANLTDIEAGDTVKFYIDGNLAKISDTSLYAEHTLSGGETTYTFSNVTFPLNALGGDGEPIPYEIKLVVFDAFGNETEDIKANYKVEEGLDVYLGDSLYTTRSKKKINFDSTTISVAMNRSEQGTMTFSLANEVAPNTVIATLSNSMNGIVSSTDFTLTKTSEITDDGRYLLTPKFTDQSNFEYFAQDNGYLAVKRSVPAITSLVITQDVSNANILNKAEDADPISAKFQSTVVVNLSNVYLDADDCIDTSVDPQKNNQVTLELRQASANGTILGSGKVACDGSITISADFPESATSYVIYASLEDNFGNALLNSNQTSVTVDITAPTITNVVAASKSFANDLKFLAYEDGDSNISGFQSNLTVSTSGNASWVKVETTGFLEEQAPVSDSTDFGTVSINDGTYNFTVIATDAAGNSSTVTYTNLIVDTLVPSLTLSIANTTVTDTEDEDSGTSGIQVTATVNNMLNIETGQTVYIQKSDDAVNWTNFASFVKAASNTESLVVTVPVGTYKLRAFASDINAQEGVSSNVDMSVSSSNCSIVKVEKGSTSLGTSGNNYFNSTDVVAGKVSLVVTLSSSCGGYTLTAKKGTNLAGTVNVDATTEAMDISFTDGEDLTLLFEVSSTPIASASYHVIVDLVDPSVVKIFPASGTVSYVNLSNVLINGTTIIGSDGGLVTIETKVTNANGGSIEMISNDGSTDTSHETITPTSDDFTATFTGKTLADNKVHTIKFKVLDIAGNEVTTTLYTATVDVTNPGNLTNLSYVGMSDTERRKADLNLTWTQSATGDDGSVGNVAKYVVKYSLTLNEGNFEDTTHEEVVINNPDMSTAGFNKLLTSLIFHKNYTLGVRAYDELGNMSDVITVSTGVDLNLVINQLPAVGASTMNQLKDVGDINSDGFNDFVVSEAFSSGSGGVYIYYGNGTEVLGTPQLIQAPISDWGGFGMSVTSGDFDGDNQTDLLVGAFLSNKYTCTAGTNACNTGLVYVFYNQGGGTQIDQSVYTLIKNSDLENEANLGIYNNAQFGVSMDFMGKINASNFNSFVFGQPASADGGKAFIIQGESGRPAQIDVANYSGNVVDILHDFGTTGNFGYTVSSLGDMDNNGEVDIVIGSHAYKKVSLFYLDANIFTTGVLTANADSTGDAVVMSDAGDNYGLEVLGNIDLNGDGNKDLAVTASTTGVYVYYGDGNKFTAGTAFIKINVPTGGQNSWNNNLDIADFNGDGKDDFVIGGNPKLNIYLSKINNFTTGVQPDIILDGTLDFEPNATGILKSGAFDVNNDGVYDFMTCDLDSKNCFIQY